MSNLNTYNKLQIDLVICNDIEITDCCDGMSSAGEIMDVVAKWPRGCATLGKVFMGATGLGTLGNQNGIIGATAIVSFFNQPSDVTCFSHEVGHNFGIHHTHGDGLDKCTVPWCGSGHSCARRDLGNKGAGAGGGGTQGPFNKTVDCVDENGAYIIWPPGCRCNDPFDNCPGFHGKGTIACVGCGTCPSNNGTLMSYCDHVKDCKRTKQFHVKNAAAVKKNAAALPPPSPGGGGGTTSSPGGGGWWNKFGKRNLSEQKTKKTFDDNIMEYMNY